MIYQANFLGRTLGAIGIFYPIVATIEAENEREAEMKLYEQYDTLKGFNLKPLA